MSVTLDPGETFPVGYRDDAGNYTADSVSADTTNKHHRRNDRRSQSGPPRRNTVPYTRDVLAVHLFAALRVGIYKGHPHWKQYRLERALIALSERVREEVDSLQDLQTEHQLVDTVTSAEHAFEAGNLQTTAAYLEDLRRLLDD